MSLGWGTRNAPYRPAFLVFGRAAIAVLFFSGAEQHTYVCAYVCVCGHVRMRVRACVRTRAPQALHVCVAPSLLLLAVSSGRVHTLFQVPYSGQVETRFRQFGSQRQADSNRLLPSSSRIAHHFCVLVGIACDFPSPESRGWRDDSEGAWALRQHSVIDLFVHERHPHRPLSFLNPRRRRSSEQREESASSLTKPQPHRLATMDAQELLDFEGVPYEKKGQVAVYGRTVDIPSKCAVCGKSKGPVKLMRCAR